MTTFPDGNTIAQTGAICIALGQALKLAPEGAGPSAKALQLTMDTADMLSDLTGKKGCDRVMKWVNHFEAALGDKPYMMGDKPTYVDYTALGAFAIIPLKQEKGVEDIKGVDMTMKLKAWYEIMVADPAVKKVMDMAPFLPDSFL
jgi:glutathione S-transferase